MTLDGKRLVEIKCPFKGRDSTLWKSVEAGNLPEHYKWQVEHQLMVTKAEVAEVYVSDGTEGILLEVAPTPSTWPGSTPLGMSLVRSSPLVRHHR